MNNEEKIVSSDETVVEEIKVSSNEETKTEGKKLSKGALAGIIGGGVALLAVVVILLVTLLGGNKTPTPPEDTHVNYVEQVKLDMNSSTKKLQVTMKMHIDGDTTHFFVPETVDVNGYIKARYLAINTPESTGKIEEWGKAASRFTQEKLENAYSIIVESDTDSWNFDGNGRYLVWVWYQPSADAEYRNLNLEILQEGLAVGSKSSDTRYGDAAVNCIAQATREKLYVFSDAIDPDFPYGEATSVTVKELRTNAAAYSGAKVSVEGIVTYNSNYTVYIEEYDPETDMYYGMQVFYGYNTSLHSVFAQGNKVRVVGVVSDFHGTWQISGLTYNPMRPTDPANTAKLSSGNDVPFTETTIEKFNSQVTINLNDEDKTFKYTQLAVSTSISMKDLTVVKVYTTTKGDSAGAMTLTCEDSEGNQIDIRTEVLKDASGNIITESYFMGKTIDVKGVIDYFDLNDTGNGTYQIKVYTVNDVTVH